MEDLIAAGEIAASINARGDLLSGNDGDDYLYGANAKDLLFGGAGHDLIVSGGGDDIILGDMDSTAATSEWTAE
ncbi:MAG: hypothetical protein HZA60_10205, partial [Deltaproteobacteria bacterium]|nr:hypothetical protein [Deltaproteobacteria bacterium]